MRNISCYYYLKNVMPRSWQIRLRQIVARRKRRQVADVWPILPTAGRPPPGWRGWPEGKKFALILTHDVETQRGLDRCRAIMDVEEQYGCRSVFNFVPERYHVPADLRAEMMARGFEVGIHGLRHDLSLFQSKAEFTRQAQTINRYLQEWGAVGFRAPYMISNLAWIRDGLKLEYDASAFDTDPFELQPDGMGTIFPFFLNDRSGTPPVPEGVPGEGLPPREPAPMVELPYTLPQDHNLFVLLGETTTGVWQTKLDWIVAQGGMALLNTHPDYMQAGPRQAVDEYPLRLYEIFLADVRARYTGQYWHALPREVAAFCHEHPERVRHGIPRRICMLAYSFYDYDNRIRRYAETLVKEGHQVEAISLSRPGQPPGGVLSGVTVSRLQTRTRNEKGAFSYLYRMLRFLCHAARVLAQKHAQRPFDLIHVHSVPDFAVFAAWRQKRQGARVILDIHDLVPEFYLSKFRGRHGAYAYGCLRWLERLSARFADHVIIANHLWWETLKKRSVSPEKSSVVLNNVDLDIFYRHTRTRQDKRFIVVYPGGLQWHQGVDIAVQAFAQIAARAPQAEFHIYGEGDEKEPLQRLIQSLQMESRIFMYPAVPFQQVPQVMADADLGIVPKRADGFGNEAYSTKIMEFMSQGVPVLASRTSIDQYYFKGGEVHFFTSGDVDELAAGMLRAVTDVPFRETLIERGLHYVTCHNWVSKRQEYLDLVTRLVER
jgi:glycosyltransferase involved in cell wall biosynthesis/peptidoglycan/xylan/chitin deacetylase (PgdA/CDA1 family)